MSRSKLASLLFVSASLSSCAVLSSAPPPLPHVSSPPVTSAPADEREVIEAADRGARVEAVAKVLRSRSRRSALTSHEIGVLAYTIVREADRHDLDPRLVLAVMAVESGFHNFAVSHVGALGLMQVMPATGMELADRLGIHWRGPTTLFDPVVNVRLGTAYLRELADRYGSISTALAAYNWGPGRIDRRIRRGTPLPVRYANLVLEKYEAQQSEQSS